MRTCGSGHKGIQVSHVCAVNVADLAQVVLMKEEYEKRRDTEELNTKENRAVFPDLDKSKVSDWCSVWLGVVSFKMFDCVTTPCKN